MGQKDLTEKSLEQYPDVFADVVNVLMHQGRRVLEEECLQMAPTETIYPDAEGQLHNQFHDVSMYEMHAGRIRVQYTLENETKINRKLVLRKAGYLGAVYRRQYDGGAVYPIVSMALYWGKRRWRGARSLRQLVAPEKELSKYVDNVHLHVYEMAQLPAEIRSRFQSDMRLVVDFLAEGKDYVPTGQKIVHVEALFRMLSALTEDDRFEELIPKALEVEQAKGEITMCEWLDKYEKLGMEKGMEKGIGRVNALIKCLIGDGRGDEIARMASDVEYQKRLLVEYGL